MIQLIAEVLLLFSKVIVALICAEAVMSWFTPSFGPQLWKIYDLMHNLTEPFILPFRKLLWRFSSQMGIDFSPVVAILAVQFITRLVIRILFSVASI